MEKFNKQMEQAILNSKLKSIQELLEALSPESVYKLIKVCGGCVITVPLFSTLKLEERDEYIRQDFFSGVSVNDIAKKYRISTRQIRNIINGKKHSVT